jgi:transposase
MVSFGAQMDHEQKQIALERRRRRGARLLAAGVPGRGRQTRQATRQSVMRWDRARLSGGVESLRRPKHFGRPRKLSDAQCEQLIELLKAGALAAGFGTELWTLPRITVLIEQRFAVRLTQPSVWRLLGGLGWSVQGLGNKGGGLR